MAVPLLLGAGITLGTGLGLWRTEEGKHAATQFALGASDALTNGLTWVNEAFGFSGVKTPYSKNPLQITISKSVEELGAGFKDDSIKEETSDLGVSRAFTTGPTWFQNISANLERNVDLINTGLLLYSLARPDRATDALKASFATQALAGQWRPSFINDRNEKVEESSWARRLDPLIQISLSAGLGRLL